MNTTLHLKPLEAVKVFPYARARVFTDQRQAVPGTPLASGTADANGTLILDLPQRTELLAQRADLSAVHVMNGTTRVST